MENAKRVLASVGDSSQFSGVNAVFEIREIYDGALQNYIDENKGRLLSVKEEMCDAVRLANTIRHDLLAFVFVADEIVDRLNERLSDSKK